MEAVERTRTRKKAIKRLIEASVERVDTSKPIHIAVMHADALDEAQVVADEIKETYPEAEMFISEITPVLGVHGGPKLVGIGIYNE